MRHVKLCLPSLLILLLVIGSISLAKDKDPAPPPPVRVTVGEFALKAITIVVDDREALASMTADEAIARLKRAGVRFQGSAGDPISEGEKSSFFLAVANGLLERLSQPPQGFDTCAGLPTVPECRSCCLELTGANLTLCGRACGRAHAAQQVSASEPTP